jgi:hypothetical protein
MFFYFEDLFRQALAGINATAVPGTMVQIGGAILVATLLFNVYEAFVRGGDVRTLAIGSAKYLILGLILLNYQQIFLGVNTMFNQVAEFISQTGPGGIDVFRQWGKDIWTFALNDQGWLQKFFPLVTGTATAIVSMILVVVGLVLYAVAYALFCMFYAFYGSILYVCGPLVLALYPALSTTSLARTYLTNLITFHAWGLIYAILGCLMTAINLGTVGQMFAAGDAAGFFVGAGNTLLLALTSILFAICIGLIPFFARRIVQGDVGSTMFAVVSAAVTAATLGATVAINGLAAALGGGGGTAHQTGGGSGGGQGGGRGGSGGGPSGAARSSQQAPLPPTTSDSLAAAGSADGATTRTSPRSAPEGEQGSGAQQDVAATTLTPTEPAAASGTNAATGSGPGGTRDGGDRDSSRERSPAGWRVYTPLSLAALGAASAGAFVNRGAKRVTRALRSTGRESEAE